MAEKVKDAIKANGHIAIPAIKFAEVKQRQLEAWTKAFQAEGGPDAVGVAILAGITVRTLVQEGILVEPAWTSADDVDDAPPWLVIEISRRFDDLYGELTTIPKA